MRKGRILIGVAIVGAGGFGAALLAMQLNGAFGQFTGAVGTDGGPGTGRGSVDTVFPASTSVAVAPVSVPPQAEESAALAPAAVTAGTLPSPVEAFEATRAAIESRVQSAALPHGSPMSSSDIADLLASDPRMQAALLDLARDADPEVRRDAAEFLAGFEDDAEPSASE